MLRKLVQRVAVLYRGMFNKGLAWLFVVTQPVYKRLRPSDVAYIYCSHPVLTLFIARLNTKLGTSIHVLKTGDDFSAYRKVIIPNGQWPSIKPTCDQIPKAKRVYCEVGFFPQNHNVYFDNEGVHGHSSTRSIELNRLTASEKSQLDEFKQFYLSQNFIRVSWDTVAGDNHSGDESLSKYQPPFILVPLQLETDTAFELCPFSNNQEIIQTIEQYLPDKRIIFKVHPLDKESDYRVSDKNVLLPRSNRDLQSLLANCEAVVNCNSTVMLEALLHDKKCASLGIGPATNHNIALECQENPEKLRQLNEWQVEPDKVDSFLFHLLQKQISTEFWKSSIEKEKLMGWLETYEIVPQT